MRAQALRSAILETSSLAGVIQIPDTVGDIKVTADLRANTMTCSVDVDAPKTVRATTRVNWLVRQLKNAPDALRVEDFTLKQRGAGAAELLGAVRQDPTVLVLDPTKEMRVFRVAFTVPMGTKRGRGRGAFIDSLMGAVDTFYEDTVQNIKAWPAAPPKLRSEVEVTPEEPPSLTSTALSSQDGAEG